MIEINEREDGNHSVIVKGIPVAFSTKDLYGDWDDTKKDLLANVRDLYSDLIDEAAAQLYAMK